MGPVRLTGMSGTVSQSTTTRGAEASSPARMATLAVYTVTAASARVPAATRPLSKSGTSSEATGL
jgi:hypothetical protein